MAIVAFHKPNTWQIQIHDDRGHWMGSVACPQNVVSVTSSGTCVFATTATGITYVYECASGHPYQKTTFYN